MNLDLDRLPGEEFRQGGLQGSLVVLNNGKASPFEGNYLKGRWDDFYFKYFHSTDPNRGALKHEWTTLVDSGVISPANLIGERDWKLMKKLNTNIPPSEHGA